MCRRLLVAESGGHSDWHLGASHCIGVPCGAFALRAQASLAEACGLSSSGVKTAFVAVWHLPPPGIELMPPALRGRFLSTVLPGESCLTVLCYILFVYLGLSPYDLFHLLPPSFLNISSGI